jgi:hypothetical protein
MIRTHQAKVLERYMRITRDSLWVAMGFDDRFSIASLHARIDGAVVLLR